MIGTDLDGTRVQRGQEGFGKGELGHDVKQAGSSQEDEDKDVEECRDRLSQGGWRCLRFF
jgi:hypothetical protein